MTLVICAAVLCLAALAVHLATAAVATVRCRPRPAIPAPRDAPGVSIVRPVCGIDTYDEATLGSTFWLDYPRYEILFCAASPRDPAVQLVERLIAQHPEIPARLLIGDDPVSDNPKLNNVVKGWSAAAYDWIALADSNVSMPRDYVQRLFVRWLPGTGLVCSPPVGCLPGSLGAELECAFLNTYMTRFQSAADAIGCGFAQGKTLFWWRPLLDRAGGPRALAAEPAEDAASTKLVRAHGLSVRIVDAPFGQPLGVRSFAEVWRRQVRWARLRRSTFPLLYVLEILSTGLWPLLALPLAAAELGYSPWAALAAAALLWYGAEAMLAHAAAWHLTLRSPLLWLLRDLVIPVLWIEGWRASDFSWRGHDMTTAAGTRGA
jgi:ceramide glucosyltransferase